MSPEELKMHQLNLIYSVREGIITWFEFFEAWKKVCGTEWVGSDLKLVG